MKPLVAAFAVAMSFACAAAQAQTPRAVDPAVADAVRQLMTVTKSRELTELWLRQMEEGFPKQAQAIFEPALDASPDMSVGQKAEARANLEKSIAAARAQLHQIVTDPKLVDELLAETAPLYAQTYTLSELRQLTAFYRSPLGQKVLASEPKVMSASAEIIDRVMLPRLQQMIATLSTQVATPPVTSKPQ